ncbi:MAG: hypothetical protein K2M41_02645 [Muribaculaceae bacterium]|nr:hypothetical protein [Muribaculaceae bacterium]
MLFPLFKNVIKRILTNSSNLDNKPGKMEIYLLKQHVSNQQMQWGAFFELAEAYALLGRNADAYASVSGWEDGVEVVGWWGYW